MNLLLRHPGLASLDCAACQKYVHDFATGQRKRFAGGSRDQPRVTPPPCRTVRGCPKGSPEQEAEHVLTPANRRTFERYLEQQAFSGGCLNSRQRADPLLRRHFAVIDAVVRAWRRDQWADALAQRLLTPPHDD